MALGSFFSSIIPSVAGSLVSGLLSNKGASDQNAANIAISQRQMDFQERMSSTAYQRSMADMRKAGLNPILAYKTGGASSPGGAGIPSVNEMTGLADQVGAATGKSLQAMLLKDQAKNTRQQTQKSRAETYLTGQLEQKAKYETASAKYASELNQVLSTLERRWLLTEEGYWFWKANKIGQSLNPLANSAVRVRQK